jgi:hypothetical protein
MSNENKGCYDSRRRRFVEWLNQMDEKPNLSDDPVVLMRQKTCKHGWIIGPRGKRCAHCGVDQDLIEVLADMNPDNFPRKSE